MESYGLSSFKPHFEGIEVFYPILVNRVCSVGGGIGGLGGSSSLMPHSTPLERKRAAEAAAKAAAAKAAAEERARQAEAERIARIIPQAPDSSDITFRGVKTTQVSGGAESGLGVSDRRIAMEGGGISLRDGESASLVGQKLTPTEAYRQTQRLENFPKTWEEYKKYDPYVLFREDAEDRLKVLPESERPVIYNVSDKAIKLWTEWASKIGTEEDKRIEPTRLHVSGGTLVGPRFLGPKTRGGLALIYLGLIANDPNRVWDIPTESKDIVVPKPEYINQALLDDVNYEYRQVSGAGGIPKPQTEGRKDSGTFQYNPNAGGFWHPLSNEAKYDSRIVDALDKTKYQEKLKAVDKYASQFSTVIHGGAGGGGGMGIQGKEEAKSEITQVMGYGSGMTLPGVMVTTVPNVSTTISSQGQVVVLPAGLASLNAEAQRAATQVGYGNLSGDEVKTILNVLAENQAINQGQVLADKTPEERTERIEKNVKSIADVTKAATPLTPVLLTDAVNRDEKNPAKILAESGFTKAARQAGGEQDNQGNWKTTTSTEKYLATLKIFLGDEVDRGVQAVPGEKQLKSQIVSDALKQAERNAIENPINKTNEPTTLEGVLRAEGYTDMADQLTYVNEAGQRVSKPDAEISQIISSWGESKDRTVKGGSPITYVQWVPDNTGKYAWQAIDQNGNPYEYGVIQRGIWWAIGSPNDRNILIVDKNYLADKNDTITQNWITFSELSEAVASGRVGRPSEIRQKEIDATKDRVTDPLYTALSNDDKNTLFNLPEEKRIEFLQGVYKNKGIVVDVTEGVVSLIANASNIDYYASQYPDSDTDKWGKVIGAIKRYGDQRGNGIPHESVDWKEVFKDSSIYQEEHKAKGSEVSGQVLGSGQSIAVSSPYWADKPNLSANDFKETRFTVKNISEDGELVLALTIDFIDNSDKVIEGTSRTYRLDSNEANSALQFVKDSYSQGVVRDVAPTQQVTSPVIPPAGAQPYKFEYTTSGYDWSGNKIEQKNVIEVTKEGFLVSSYDLKGKLLNSYTTPLGAPSADLENMGYFALIRAVGKDKAKEVVGIVQKSLPEVAPMVTRIPVLGNIEGVATSGDKSLNIHNVKISVDGSNTIVTWETDKPTKGLVQACAGTQCNPYYDDNVGLQHRVIIDTSNVTDDLDFTIIKARVGDDPDSPDITWKPSNKNIALSADIIKGGKEVSVPTGTFASIKSKSAQIGGAFGGGWGDVSKWLGSEEGVSISEITKPPISVPEQGEMVGSLTLGANRTSYFGKFTPNSVYINPPKNMIDESIKSGRPVIVIVSAGDCPNCPAAVKLLDSMASQVPNTDTYLISVESMIDSQPDSAELSEYFDTAGGFPSVRIWQNGEIKRTGAGTVEKTTIQDAIRFASQYVPPPDMPTRPLAIGGEQPTQVDATPITPPAQTPPSLQKGVVFTPLPKGTNPEPYIKAMVSTSQYIKWFGGDKDWQSKVDAIVTKNTKDGKVDYSKAYSDIVAEKVPLFPPTVQYVPKTTPTVQPTPYVPAKVWSNVGEAKDQMYKLMNEVALRENAGQLTPEDKKFKEIVQWFAKNPDTRTQAISYTSVMERASKDIGNWYVTNQPKPISAPLPVVSTGEWMPPWEQVRISPVSQEDVFEVAKREMTTDYNLAKQREAYDKALWNSLTPEDKARLKPEVTTTAYDRKIIANWEDPKKFRSSTVRAGQDPLNYLGLATEMGKEQVLIDKARKAADYQAGKEYKDYLKEVEAKPRTIVPVPNVVQIRADAAQPLVDAALSKISSNDPNVTEQDKYYASLGNYYRGNDGKINYYSVYEKSQSSPWAIQLPRDEGEVIKAVGYGTRPEIPIDQYPTLTPTDRVTTIAGPQIPSVTEMILGKTQPEQWVGKGEMRPREIEISPLPEEVPVVYARTIEPRELETEVSWDILQPKGVTLVEPAMWYEGGTKEGPIPPPLSLSGIELYTVSPSGIGTFRGQREYFESQGGVLPEGWIFAGYDNNGNVIPISQNDFDKLSLDSQKVMLEEGMAGLNRKMGMDKSNWDITRSNILALYEGNPYEWAYQMRERGELPWATIRSLLGIGYSPETVESIMRGVPKDNELTDAEYLRTVYLNKYAGMMAGANVQPIDVEARNKAWNYIYAHPDDPRVKYDLDTYRAAVPIESKEPAMAWAQRLEKSTPIEVGLGIHEVFGKARLVSEDVNKWKESVKEALKTPEGWPIPAATLYKDPNTGDVILWNTAAKDEFTIKTDTDWADKALEDIMKNWWGEEQAVDYAKNVKGTLSKGEGIVPIASKYGIEDPYIRSVYTLNTAWEFFKSLAFGVPITIIKSSQEGLSGDQLKAAETIAQTTGGMVIFPKTQTGKTMGDYIRGDYNKATGQLGGIALSFIVNPITVGKGIWGFGQKVIGFPKTLSPYTGSNTIDIPMNPVAKAKGVGMTMTSLQTLMTDLINNGFSKDAVIYDSNGRLIARVTPLGRAKVPYQYNVMNRFNEVVEAVKRYNRGGKPIDVPAIGGRDSPWVGEGQYYSPNISIKTAAAIEPSGTIGGGEGKTGIVGAKFKYKQAPQEVQAKWNEVSNLDPQRTPFDIVEKIMNEAEEIYVKLDKEGKLAGFYPVFKTWSLPSVNKMIAYLEKNKASVPSGLKGALQQRPVTWDVIRRTYNEIIKNVPADKIPEVRNDLTEWWLELETYQSKGSKLYPTKGTWDTTIKEIGDDSGGSYIRVSEDITNDTGKVVYAKGEKAPIIWLSETPNDIAPTFQQRMLAEWVYEPASVLRRLLTSRPQFALGYGGTEVGDLTTLKFGKRKSVYDYFDRDRRSTLIMRDPSNPNRILVGRQYSVEKGRPEYHFDTIGGKPHKAGESTLDTVKREAIDEAGTYAYGGTYVGSVKGRHMNDKVKGKYVEKDRYFDIYDVEYKGIPEPSSEIVELAWYDGKKLYDMAGNPIVGQVSDITPKLYKTWSDGLSTGAKFIINEPPRGVGTELPSSYKKEITGKDTAGKDIVKYSMVVKPEKALVILEDNSGRLVSNGEIVKVERKEGQTISQAIEEELINRGLAPSEYSFVQTWEEFPSGVYTEYAPSTITDLYVAKLKDVSDLSYITDIDLANIYGKYSEAYSQLKDVLKYKEFNPSDVTGKSAYLSIEIPDISKKSIVRIQDKLRAEAVKQGWDFVTFPSSDKLHITIKYIGNPTAREVALLENVALELSGYLKDNPIDIRLGEWMTWGKGGPNIKDVDVVSLVLKSTKDMETLSPLKNKIEALATQAGLSADQVYFDPHITIAEIKSGASIDNRIKVGGYISHNKLVSDIPIKIKEIGLREGGVKRILTKEEELSRITKEPVKPTRGRIKGTDEYKQPKVTKVKLGYIPKAEYLPKEEYPSIVEPIYKTYPQYKEYETKGYVSELAYPEKETQYTQYYPESYPEVYPPTYPPTYPTPYPPIYPTTYPPTYKPPTPPVYPPPVPPTTPPPVPPYPPLPPIPKVPPIPPRERFERAKAKLGDNIGIIAWKQGFIYKLLYNPYSQKDILNTRKPVEGVEYHEGLRSAYDSIVRRGGYVPPIIRRTMGIYNIEISTMKDQRKPELRFRREKSKVYRGKKRIAKMPQTRVVRF